MTNNNSNNLDSLFTNDVYSRLDALEAQVSALQAMLSKQTGVTVKDDPILDKIVDFMKSTGLKFNGKVIAANIEESSQQVYHRLEKLHRLDMITCHKQGKENPLWSWKKENTDVD